MESNLFLFRKFVGEGEGLDEKILKKVHEEMHNKKGLLAEFFFFVNPYHIYDSFLQIFKHFLYAYSFVACDAEGPKDSKSNFFDFVFLENRQNVTFFLDYFDDKKMAEAKKN
jgi:hypothetical protein